MNRRATDLREHADRRIAVEEWAWTLRDALDLARTHQIDPELLRRIVARFGRSLDELAEYEQARGIQIDRRSRTIADIVLAAEAALEIA